MYVLPSYELLTFVPMALWYCSGRFSCIFDVAAAELMGSRREKYGVL